MKMFFMKLSPNFCLFNRSAISLEKRQNFKKLTDCHCFSFFNPSQLVESEIFILM